MSVQSYPFQFVGIDSHTTDALQKDTLIYQFASSKSCHQYIVRIERYVHDLHCVKFLDATNDKSSGRFSYLSATYEPRTIFHTIFNIALDVLRNNRRASFLFIGAADNRDIIGKPTRRYRVYRLFLAEFDLDSIFEQSDYEAVSMSLLVNLSAMPTLKDRQVFRSEVCIFAGIQY